MVVRGVGITVSTKTKGVIALKTQEFNFPFLEWDIHPDDHVDTTVVKVSSDMVTVYTPKGFNQQGHPRQQGNVPFQTELPHDTLLKVSSCEVRVTDSPVPLEDNFDTADFVVIHKHTVKVYCFDDEEQVQKKRRLL